MSQWPTRVATLLLLLLPTGRLSADVAPIPLSQLREHATLIVVGKLTDLEFKDEPVEGYFADRGYVNLALYYTVQIATVEKGEGKQPGDHIVVRAYIPKERNRLEIDARQGHDMLPALGQNVRVFVGRRAVLFPNGFFPPDPMDSVLKDEDVFPWWRQASPLLRLERIEAHRIDLPPPADPRRYAWISGLVAGFLIVGAFAILIFRRNRVRFPRHPGGDH